MENKVKELEECFNSSTSVRGEGANDQLERVSVKYRGLSEYLLSSGASRISLTYAQIEQILGFPLPQTARRFKQSRWDEFNEIIKKANELGGKMYHGSFDARSGKKLGEGLSEDSLDGFIAENFFNAQKGKSITMRAPYYAAILDWAGIVKNCRSKRDGLGSYIEVNESFRNVLS